MVEYSYTVTFDPDGENFDASNDIEVLDITETGTGQVNSCLIRLNANQGRYLAGGFTAWLTATAYVIGDKRVESAKNYTCVLDHTSGTFATDLAANKWILDPPIPDEFDRFKVVLTDAASNTLTRVYEVDNIMPTQNTAGGDVVEFECLGLEHHLMRIDYAKQARFENAFIVAEDIIDFFNDQAISSTQPAIIDHDGTSTGDSKGNDLPQWNSNNYPFSNREIQSYAALTELVESGGTAVTDAGFGDFFEFNFINDTGNNNQVKFRAFSSGGTGSVTITNATSVNPGESEGGIESTSGNLVRVWGSDNGSLPPELSTFLGKLEAFQLFPDWDSNIAGDQTYPQNAWAKHNGVTYQSDIDSNASTPGVSNWTVKTEADLIGSIDYSPWTNNKAAQTKNSGSNPDPSTKGAETGFNRRGFFDMNLNISDSTTFQFQAQQRINNTSTAIDTAYLYGGTAAGTYRGLIMLVDSEVGTIISPFSDNSGKDRFDNTYDDHFVRHNGGTETGSTEWKNWDVVGPLNSAGGIRDPQSGDYAAIIDEGKIYKFNGSVWADDSATAHQNHCFHIYQDVTTSDGFWDVADGGNNYKDNSAVKVVNRYIPDIVGLLSSPTNTDSDFYRSGAWWNLRSPYPYSTHNSVSTLGALWGNNATKKEPVTWDLKNMHLSHSGNVGFNHSEAEDLGTINSIRFWVKHEWVINMSNGIGDKIIFAGDFKYRYFIYDTSGNIWVQDFTISHNNNWQFISLPIDGFKIYRARTPVSLGNIQTNLIPSGLDVLNKLNVENIATQGMQWNESYDEHGRYDPGLTRVFLQPATQALIEVAAALVGGTISLPVHVDANLYVDGWHFGKTMFSVTAPITTGRVLMPPAMQKSWIDNKYQNDQLANSQLQIEKFRHNQWTIVTEGRIDIDFGQSFFYEDSFVVNRADRNESSPGNNDGDPNTIKLVAKVINHRIDKPPTGPGGFLTTFTGVKRFEG